jgi:hypothetical protein
MAIFFRRLMGAALLDVSTYEEIEGDQRATSQALFVVMLSGLAAGAGAWGAPSGRPATALMVGTIAVLAWAAWALLIFEIGARIVPEPQIASTSVSFCERSALHQRRESCGSSEYFRALPCRCSCSRRSGCSWQQ